MDALKTMVRSVLTSSPTALTVDRLCKEYRDILGENIPFHKYGYNSVEHFLRDIPDTVQLVGTGRFATVNLVFSEKSAHIAQMVSKQKLAKKKAHQPYQRRTVVVPPQRSTYNVDSIRPAERQRMVYPPIKSSYPPTQNNSNRNSQMQYPPSKPSYTPTQNNSNRNNSQMVYPPSKPSYTPTQNNGNTHSSNYKQTIYGPPSPSTSGHSTAGTSSPEQNESNAKPFEYRSNNVEQKKSYGKPFEYRNNSVEQKEPPTKPFEYRSNSVEQKKSHTEPFEYRNNSVEQKESHAKPFENRSNSVEQTKSHTEPFEYRNNTIEQKESSVKPVENRNNSVDTDLTPNVQNLSIAKGSLSTVRRTNKSLSQSHVGAINKYLTQNSLFSQDAEGNVPANIKNNLRLLIQEHPEGMWCTELPIFYRKKFNTELKFFELGFRNLIELCMDLKSVFHWARPGQGDFRLYDKSKPLPDNAEKNFTVASYSKPIETISKPQVDGAVPPLDWEDVLGFLPQDVLLLGDEIPRYFVPRETTENDILDVVVCEICDASKFWVIADNGKLDKLMDDMQEFYNKDGDKYKIPKALIRKGLYCVSIIFGEYHRGLITEVMSNGKNRIFYIDYGTIRIDTNELYFLHDRFSELPAQTLRCKLTGIQPPIKGAAWSNESTLEFKALTKTDKKYVAKISRIKWEEQVLEVFLADVSSTPVFYINDRLVKKGHAVYVDQEQQTIKVDSLSRQLVSNLHLFPTFVELEYGLAPSYEMDNFYDLNVPIKFCYPQYFETDYSNEERSIEERFKTYEKVVLKTLRTQKFQFSRKDIEYFEDKSIDYDFFGALRDEIEEFALKQKLGKNTEKLNDHSEEQNQNKELSIEEQELKIEGLKELTVNRMLSEDILKDITTIATYSDASAEELMKELDVMSEYTESHASIYTEGKDHEINHRYYDYEKNSEPSDNQNRQDLVFSSLTSAQASDYGSDVYHDLSVDNMSRHNSQYPPVKNRFDYIKQKITSLQLQPEDTTSEPYFTGDEITAKISEGSYTEKQKSTNPFWNSDEENENISRLHPTNPFLYHLKNAEEPSHQRTLDVSTSLSSYSEVEIQRQLNVVNRANSVLTSTNNPIQGNNANISTTCQTNRNLMVNTVNPVVTTTNNPVRVTNTNVSTACQTNIDNGRSSLDVNALPFFPTFSCTVPVNPLPVNPYYAYNLPAYDPTVFCNPYYQRTLTPSVLMTPSFTPQPQILTNFNKPRCPPPPGFLPK
ncbi:uncharacterized protein LOC126885747 [Diabrotica virgifera virgifera]|uniref:HTH OST-type domain-containing protein n=1 Tax=Diabrotica virgifera virgifera TaxID=50390 RepID=A0ABM5KE69_DIAVI|nr:uncharacterized protein LOC126885747 [Diabrotica virgifera virgifera]